MSILENKEMITNLFNLKNEKELEETILKLKHVELIWTEDNFTLIDLINSWNNVSNENAITMIQLLESFYKASASSKANALSVEDLNNLTAYVASTTREQGLIIGNALKSILTRISTDEVIYELNKKDISVSKNDSVDGVLNKIKNHINKFTNKDERSGEILDISKIIGGNYHLARASAILNNIW